jgi:hypothetical protein
MGGFKWKIKRKQAMLEYEKRNSDPKQTMMLFA